MLQPRTRPLLPDVVRSALRRAIIEGEFLPGSKLPNEDALCARFAVSRITLREAVRGLIEDGYVVRRQGSGTYVTEGPRLRNSLDTNFSYTEYLESTGVVVTRQVLDARRLPADETVATALNLASGADVVVVRRVRSADGKPAIYSVDSLPTDIADAGRDLAAFGTSLYKLLADRGHTVDHARAALAPVIADAELSALLGVAVGTPLQHLRQVDHDASGRPVMLSLEWHVPEVIELRVYRRGPGPQAQGSDAARGR
ncbi:GntR family transcriptional regulator [Devosia sp.]|uniref:GntR family transcriptional regulator n=1 Tax=Devosia sp. TaxID=1871048 RepID=UPI003F6F9538